MSEDAKVNGGKAHVNLRVFVLCALGLVFGIFLCFRVRFGGLRPSDFVFLAVFLVFALLPFSKKRLLVVGLCVLLFAGAGFGVAHLKTESFLQGKGAGNYFVAGTVTSFTVKNGRTEVVLSDLSLDGAPVGGKMKLTVNSEAVRAGDILSFRANVTRNGLPMSGNSYSEYLFYSDIRYTCGNVEYNKVGTAFNPFLRLNAALYDCLRAGMGGEEGQIAYALLTGNSHGMDEGLLAEVRTGGIAHIFAVSGLHIGILFATVLLLCRKMNRWAFFPAIGVALLYTCFCAFTVSSVRALLMCAVLGGYRAIGRKYDFLQSISLAAIVVLLFRPADFLSAGFRLSFGACMGLALFSGSLTRLFGKIPHFPRFLGGYLAANLSVQIFTFPILLDTFGYFSVWGFLLNLIFIPLLAVVFLTVLLFSLLALIVPPAATFFLVVPKGLLSLFLLLFSLGDFSFVLKGFSLGMGGAILLVAFLLLSERFRIKWKTRAVVAVSLAAAFLLAVLFENVVFTGGKITVYTRDGGAAALIQTQEVCVLVIDGDIRTRYLNDFLMRHVAGRLDAVFVLSEDEQNGINHAAFLPVDAIYAKDAIPTGLRETPVFFVDTATVGGLVFRFERRDKLVMTAEGVAVEFDFENPAALDADLFVDSSSGGLKFSFRNGIIKAL